MLTRVGWRWFGDYRAPVFEEYDGTRWALVRGSRVYLDDDDDEGED